MSSEPNVNANVAVVVVVASWLQNIKALDLATRYAIIIMIIIIIIVIFVVEYYVVVVVVQLFL